MRQAMNTESKSLQEAIVHSSNPNFENSLGPCFMVSVLLVFKSHTFRATSGRHKRDGRIPA